jgi:hypothetical protein
MPTKTEPNETAEAGDRERGELSPSGAGRPIPLKTEQNHPKSEKVIRPSNRTLNFGSGDDV